jgi:hypothetical protein
MYGRLGMTGASVGRGDKDVMKVDTTMSEEDAALVRRQYGIHGSLPKQLNREGRMRAYEGRYIAAGGKKGEKWKRRSKTARVGATVGLASATGGAIGLLAMRGKHTGKAIGSIPGVSRIKTRHLETAGLTGAAGGGASELYGQYAQHKRAKYTSAPAGVAASALTRMRNYTPGAS